MEQEVWLQHKDHCVLFDVEGGRLDVKEIAKVWNLDPSSLVIASRKVKMDDNGLSTRLIHAFWGVEEGRDGRSKENALTVTGQSSTAVDDTRVKRQKIDYGSRGKSHKVDWMQQLLSPACDRDSWQNAVVKGVDIIEPLPWPFCPIEEEDAVENEGSEETEDEDAVESETAKGQDSTATSEFSLRLVNLGENKTVKAIWGKKSDLKIIERKSYIDLWSRIKPLFRTEGRQSLLLLGNPGVGKTAFLLYVVLMLLQEKKKILMQTKGGELYFFNYEGDQYSFSRPQSLFETDLDVDEEIHYLVDGKLPDVPVYIGKCLLAATPLHSNFKDFVKDEGLKKFYLPVWSASEMALLRQEVFSQIPKKILEERYTQWGGIPRFVLEYPDVKMSTVIDTLPAIQDLVYAVTSQKAGRDHPSHKVIYMKVAANYENFELIYASPYVREKVFEVLHSQGLETLKAFLIFNGKGLQGYAQLQGGILELFFKRAATEKRSFPVVEVFEGIGQGEEKMIEFVFGDPKYVKTLADVIPATHQDRIIWSQKTNQETVDSFVLRKQSDGSYILQCFQVTLSSSKRDHWLKYAGLLDLMNRFKIAAGKVEVYMVTIESRFKEAGYQSWRIENNKVLCAKRILRKMKGIRQFALNCGGA